MNARDVPSIWTTGTTEVFKTGTWRAALPKHIHAPSPCHAACPVEGDIAEWIGRAREGDLRGAWDILTRHNPFPAVSGRVCHHPCESACNRNAYDGAVAIRCLERHVGDRALAEGWTYPAVESRREASIAVVGGGPSGLSAAFHLRRSGYAVTLFESRPQLGGVMRYGIPSYRLPRSVLHGEIGRILALGVEARCGEAIRTDRDFARLRADFDAVYLAIGAQRQKRLPVLDYAKPWVMDGAQYLAQANAGTPPRLGRRVVVIGGGSAAIDAARSARRAGHDVTLLALESRAQMPAQKEEVVEALEEGVALVDGSMLEGVTDRAEQGIELACVRVRFEPGAVRGRFTVTRIEASGFTLEADTIVTSIGQDPDACALGGGLDLDGALVRVDRDQSTSVQRVYAGGDVASLARFVTEAIGMGKRAAREIDRVLRGASRLQEDEEALVGFERINAFYHPRQPRTGQQRLDAQARVADDAEVELGWDAEQARREAERCFSCGTCIECDNCVHYCPDLAVVRKDGGYEVLSDYCKGCGLCVKECPTGSMKMVEERR